MGLPNEIHPFHLAGAGQGYQVANSLRFRASNTAYLSRTFGTPTDGKKWTWSGWLKRGSFGVNTIFGATSGTATGLVFSTQTDNDCLGFAYGGNWRRGSQVYRRDCSAWYHIVMIFDSANATEANRAILYVNGSQQTWATSTSITQNDTTAWNTNSVSGGIGQNLSGLGSTYFDGYMAEVNFIDGQALDSSYFGQTDSVTGAWNPKKYTGTYGTNGFYLPFNDATSTTTLGYDRQLGMADSSKNNWTASGISVTSGTTYDSMIDSPTNWNDGSTYYNRGNYSIGNPLQIGTNIVLTNGNLTATTSAGAAYKSIVGNVGMSSGKWYWEITPTVMGANKGVSVGIESNPAAVINTWPGNTATSVGYMAYNGYKYYSSGSFVAYGATVAVNDVVGVALDMDGGTLTMYKNGVSQGAMATGLTGTYFPAVSGYDSGDSFAINFGQRPFSYTPPTGFLALNTYNLANPSLPLV